MTENPGSGLVKQAIQARSGKCHIVVMVDVDVDVDVDEVTDVVVAVGEEQDVVTKLFKVYTLVKYP